MKTVFILFLFVIGITIISSTIRQKYYLQKFDEIFPKLSKTNLNIKKVILISLGMISIIIGVILQLGDYKIINPLN